MQFAVCGFQPQRAYGYVFAGATMSAASKGRAFEHTVRNMFQQAGYSVIRGAGSKGELLGHKVDLVCSKLTPTNQYRVVLTVIGVQCKVRKRP